MNSLALNDHRLELFHIIGQIESVHAHAFTTFRVKGMFRQNALIQNILKKNKTATEDFDDRAEKTIAHRQTVRGSRQ